MEHEREKWRPLFSAYVDGALDVPTRRALEAHLAGCRESAAEVADLRATSSITRMSFESLAEAEDFSGFAADVISRAGTQGIPLRERLSLFFAQSWMYHRRSLALAAAAALVAVGVSVPVALQMRAPDGYAADKAQLQAVRVEAGSGVEPVVMETEAGDTIVWMLDLPARPSTEPGERDEELDVTRPAPKAGEL